MRAAQAHGEVIGVLQILNPRDKESFDEQELEGFTAYANLTATAIEKLRALETHARAGARRARPGHRQRHPARTARARDSPAHPRSHFCRPQQAASNVGGDFYNVFVRSPDETYFAIGDVSGKGISASLLMAQTLSAMQFVFAHDDKPVGRSGQVEFDARVSTSSAECLSRPSWDASSPPRTESSWRAPAIASRSCFARTARLVEIETDGSLPLGILPKVAYRQGKIDLHRGDWFVCYTDGLSESRNSADEAFFEQKIIPSLAGRKF